jgi:hypothetical protein
MSSTDAMIVDNVLFTKNFTHCPNFCFPIVVGYLARYSTQLGIRSLHVTALLPAPACCWS